jgi:hypothetical protein
MMLPNYSVPRQGKMLDLSFMFRNPRQPPPQQAGESGSLGGSPAPAAELPPIPLSPEIPENPYTEMLSKLGSTSSKRQTRSPWVR